MSYRIHFIALLQQVHSLYKIWKFINKDDLNFFSVIYVLPSFNFLLFFFFSYFLTVTMSASFLRFLTLLLACA